MVKVDRSAERAFVRQLLTATRAGRPGWTPTAAPEAYQFVAGGFVVVASRGSGGAELSLHGRTGHALDILMAHQLDAERGDEPAYGPQLEEIYLLARRQALAVRKAWRVVGKQLASFGVAGADADA